ncbi:MAG: 4-hydroxythreonine-4-phosphate dehydrogenase PdxA [Muribaculaceae bacterium]|nr:4-hydroxythreonine-4-phosphate dehydrogenase PdxA [Muribaculaceae bacterium]
MHDKIKVGITHGDYNGVGYEVILKALAGEEILGLMTPVLFGSSDVAASTIKTLGIEGVHFSPVKTAADARDGRINIVDVCSKTPEVNPGTPSPEAGKAAFEALNAAVRSLREGEIDVLVTAPIDKNSIQSDEFKYQGHTEFLEQHVGGGEKSLMILFNDNLRVALVTIHLPISKVAENITRQRVYDSIKAFDASLRRDFGIERPLIAVLGLNPHCGDRGMIGTEEYTAILPAIDDSVEEGFLAFGPFAADGFFATGKYRNYDGVLAMYHDQGLAPFKSIAENKGVNFTAGLPIVRTSPDHGTGYDIAGKGEADPESMRNAIYNAIDIYRNRERYDDMTSNPLPSGRNQKS